MVCPNTGHEIIWDGRVVWVNSCVDGMSLGRFSSHGGIDVHKPFAEQKASGSACLDCSPDGSEKGWKRFCTSMLEHHNVAVPERAKPKERT